MADDAAAAAAALAATAAADQIALLTRLVAQLATTRLQPQRPKAINCCMYKLGNSWPDFATHFYQTIKATYNFSLPTDKDALEEACCSWLPSKLEPGPTLVTYDSLAHVSGTDA